MQVTDDTGRSKRPLQSSLELIDGSNYDGAYLRATAASTKAQYVLSLIPSAPILAASSRYRLPNWPW